MFVFQFSANIQLLSLIEIQISRTSWLEENAISHRYSVQCYFIEHSKYEYMPIKAAVSSKILKRIFLRSIHFFDKMKFHFKTKSNVRSGFGKRLLPEIIGPLKAPFNAF